MLGIFAEIVRSYKDNIRRVYPEPSVGIYNKGGYENLDPQQLKDKTRYMLSLRPLQLGYHVLDIGCGNGEMVMTLARLGLQYVVGVDVSQDSIDICKGKSASQVTQGQNVFKRMSATDLKFDDAVFDVVYMADMVEHLSDANLRKAIAEAHRVLKPGGHLLIHTAPTVNYKLCGQYIAKYYFGLQGRSWLTLTSREEAALGHVNIQSQSSLKSYLCGSFRPNQVKAFYGPVNPKGALKKLISLLGLWPLLSYHLWAVARK